MIGFELLRPHMWPWLLAALALVALARFGLARRRASLARLATSSGMARFLPGFSPGRASARAALAGVGALLLGVSLLGPVRGYTERDVQRRGLDFVVCVDTSRSMLAEDLRPNRLERALREVRGLLDRLQGDRVAVIGFSGDAREIAPLTDDRFTLRALLGQLRPEENRRGGTDLGAALERALSMFDGRTGAHEAIVLLTDGEDLEGRGLEVAQRAKEKGIRVYVVGIGTGGGSKIPLGGGGFVRDADGQEVVTQLEDESLRSLAQATGGEYLSTESSPTPLEELYQKRISRLDRRELEGGLIRIPHDRYQWTLALALACMLVEAGLRERGRTRARASAASERRLEEAA